MGSNTHADKFSIGDRVTFDMVEDDINKDSRKIQGVITEKRKKCRQYPHGSVVVEDSDHMYTVQHFGTGWLRKDN
jgi:hypothetical protein